MGGKRAPEYITRDWMETTDRQNEELKQVMEEIARIGGKRPHQGPSAEDQ